MLLNRQYQYHWKKEIKMASTYKLWQNFYNPVHQSDGKWESLNTTSDPSIMQRESASVTAELTYQRQRVVTRYISQMHSDASLVMFLGAYGVLGLLTSDPLAQVTRMGLFKSWLIFQQQQPTILLRSKATWWLSLQLWWRHILQGDSKSSQSFTEWGLCKTHQPTLIGPASLGFCTALPGLGIWASSHDPLACAPPRVLSAPTWTPVWRNPSKWPGLGDIFKKDISRIMS